MKDIKAGLLSGFEIVKDFESSPVMKQQPKLQMAENLIIFENFYTEVSR